MYQAKTRLRMNVFVVNIFESINENYKTLIWGFFSKLLVCSALARYGCYLGRAGRAPILENGGMSCILWQIRSAFLSPR